MSECKKNAQKDASYYRFFSTCDRRGVIVNKKFTHFYLKCIDTWWENEYYVGTKFSTPSC